MDYGIWFSIDGLYTKMNNLSNIEFNYDPNAFVLGDYSFTVGDNGYVLTSYNGDASVIELPAPTTQYNGSNIGDYEIGSRAFINRRGLTSVTIPDGITTIESYSFYHCTNLTTLNLPASLITIGDLAFEGVGLTTLNLDGLNNLTDIGWAAFSNSSIHNLTISNCPSLEIGDDAFSGCTNLSSVTINNCALLTEIPMGCFNGCSSLTSINLPNTITTLNGSAFANTGLTSIDLTGITTLGDRVFSGAQIKTITLPTSITNLSTFVFDNTYSLVEVINLSNKSCNDNSILKKYTTIPETSHFTTEGDYEYYTADGVKYLIGYNGNATQITLPATGDYLPYLTSNHKLTRITVPNTVTKIPNYAFSDCTRLSPSNLILPNTITSIGKKIMSNLFWVTYFDNAFQDGILYLTASDNVTKYAVQASTRGNYTILENTKVIAASLFDNASGVAPNLPNSIEHIGDHAFQGKTLSSNYLANCTNLKSIGEYAFYQAHISGTLTLPSSLETIGDWAFSNGYSTAIQITSLTLPTSLETIGDFAFQNCTQLNTVDTSACNSLIKIGSNAFFGCTNLNAFEIPNTVTTINYRAFYGCTNLSSLTFETTSHVENIGSDAFYNCTSLTSLTIPTSVKAIGSYFISNSGITSLTFSSRTGWYKTYSSIDFGEKDTTSTNVTELTLSIYPSQIATGFNTGEIRNYYIFKL